MSSPYPSLQTRGLPGPEIWDIHPPTELQTALETIFKPLQTTYPGMLRFGKTKKQSPFLRFDHKWHLDNFIGDVPYRSGPFSGKIREYTAGAPTNQIQDISGFCKITHLLDAYRMIQGSYPVAQHPALPSPSRKSEKVYVKLHNPHNQAYVDAVACYMLSKFREADHSPHFSLFYGSYLAIAKDYYYNITEEFNDLRFEGWFWRKHTQGRFKLMAFRDNVPIDSNSSLLMPPDNISDMLSENNSETSSNITDVSNLYDYNENNADSGSLHSGTIDTVNSNDESISTEKSNTISSVLSNMDEFDDKTKIFAAVAEFPTMMIFLESNKETMDFLLDRPEEVGAEPGTKEWEERWSAWLFQVVAALCQIQSLWAMTHNDLHSNNILWVSTDKKYLYYRALNGRQFKVPTYGKIFRIIDFGRAIYTHNDVLCVSDDYWPENEAGSQYNFGPFYDPNKPRIYPNPSFDLSRLSVSIIESLFKDIPEDREGGQVISDELDRIQIETVSDLYNLLWAWLIDEDGRNILWDTDQSERYPGFDLYTVIAEKIKGAVPCEQLDKPPFSGFLMTKSDIILEGEKVYSLFC